MYYLLLKVKRVQINSVCTSISGIVLLITESENRVVLMKRVHINSFCTSISGNVLLMN